MRFPTPKVDLWLISASVALLGASRVIGSDPTHHLEVWAFWGGISGLALIALWHVIAWVSNLSRGVPEEASVSVDNRHGAYIGGDNSGTQQVFHGPVTIGGTVGPTYPDRDFVPPTLTVERLLANFDNKTDLQAQALCRPFVGKWMRVSGTVNSVNEFSREMFSVYVRLPNTEKYSYASVHCIFREKWEASLHALSKGDQVTIIGIFHSASLFSMTLTDCEIEH